MFENISVLRMANASAQHATLRQNVLAQNVANSDTPGYQRLDIAPFAQIYAQEAGQTAMTRTRDGHLGGFDPSSEDVQISEDLSAISPNGNSISIEDEMLKSVEVKRQYDLSLAILKTSLGILRSSIGKA